MLDSLEAGRIKLDEYYTQTDQAKPHIYAISTMLAPDNKFQFFLFDDWDRQWRDLYQKSFQEALVPYQEYLSTIQGSITAPIAARPSSRLNKMLNGHKPQVKPVRDEITQYLDSGMLGTLFILTYY